MRHCSVRLNNAPLTRLHRTPYRSCVSTKANFSSISGALIRPLQTTQGGAGEIHRGPSARMGAPRGRPEGRDARLFSLMLWCDLVRRARGRGGDKFTCCRRGGGSMAKGEREEGRGGEVGDREMHSGSRGMVSQHSSHQQDEYKRCIEHARLTRPSRRTANADTNTAVGKQHPPSAASHSAACSRVPLTTRPSPRRRAWTTPGPAPWRSP